MSISLPFVLISVFPYLANYCILSARPHIVNYLQLFIVPFTARISPTTTLPDQIWLMSAPACRKERKVETFLPSGSIFSNPYIDEVLLDSLFHVEQWIASCSKLRQVVCWQRARQGHVSLFSFSLQRWQEADGSSFVFFLPCCFIKKNILPWYALRMPTQGNRLNPMVCVTGHSSKSKFPAGNETVASVGWMWRQQEAEEWNRTSYLAFDQMLDNEKPRHPHEYSCRSSKYGQCQADWETSYRASTLTLCTGLSLGWFPGTEESSLFPCRPLVHHALASSHQAGKSCRSGVEKPSLEYLKFGGNIYGDSVSLQKVWARMLAVRETLRHRNVSWQGKTYSSS